MTELETKLIALLQASEAASTERESLLMKQVHSLRETVTSLQQQLEILTPQLEKSAEQQLLLMNQYEEISLFLAEELQR